MQARTAAWIDAFASTISPWSYSLSPNTGTVAFSLAVSGCSQLYTIPTAHSEYPTRITSTLDDCSLPSWSPDGKQLAFVRGNAIWTVNSDGTLPRLISEHPSGNSQPHWSPGGDRIAFLSRRRGWDHIWIIGAEGGVPVQLTKGSYDSEDPFWAPDGNGLVFCATSDDDLATRGVYLVPINSGRPELISPQGAWSGAPHFSPDGGRVAFLSDADGWFHIYLYDRTSRGVSQLTAGEFEDGGPHFYGVDPLGGPTFSPDGTALAFVRHDSGNFDVWIHEIDTHRERCISNMKGHYRIIGWLSDGRQLLVAFDNLASPPDLFILSLDGTTTRLTNSAPAIISDEKICPEWVTYPSRDALSIPAAILRPRDSDGKRLPAVIFLHGGPNFQFANYYYPLPELIAQAGFFVLAPNFRGSTGYGRAFRHANFREWGRADAFDVVDGAKWLQGQRFIDPERIAVVGPSYGGYLALAALTLAPELFCAGVDMYGDSEIAESYRHGDRYGRMDLKRHMGTPEDNPEGYRRGSPFYLADRIEAPLLILHGRNDRLVVPLMSEKMIEALRIENKYFESHFYKGEEHGFSKPENKQDAWARVLRFLGQHCGVDV